MPGAKTKPSATVPIADHSNDTPEAKPKTTIVRHINSGRAIELEYPDHTIERWSMVPKPKNTEVGLEGKMCCGDGPGFDKSHCFYLDMRSQIRLCLSATLGRERAVAWSDVSIEDKHNIISATKEAYPYLFRFTGDWGVEAMLKKVLRNARDTKKNKQKNRNGGAKARARKAPNQVAANKGADADDDDVAEVPPPKPRPATKSNNKPTSKKAKGKKRARTEEPDQPSDEDDVGPVLTEDEEGEKEGKKGEKGEEESEEDEEEEEPKKTPLRRMESAESVQSGIPSTLRASSSVLNTSEDLANHEESTQATVILNSPAANPKKRKAQEASEAAATHATKKSRTTKDSAPTFTGSDSSLSPPPSPVSAPSCSVRQGVATATKGAQKKRNAPDAIEQPQPAKKQKTATKDVAPKETIAHANPKAAANRADSWSTSYHEEVASLPPPPPPKKTKKAPRPATPEPLETNEPSDPSTSASKPRRRPLMRPPPPDSPPAETTTRAAKAELVESAEAGGSNSKKAMCKTKKAGK